MKMADKRHWVFCIALVLSLLTLGNAEEERLGYIEALRLHSAKCGYPPKETFVNESFFKKCVDETTVPKVQDICGLYENEVDRLCDTSDPLEVEEAAKETKEMLDTGLHVCEVAKRVKLSPQITEHLQGPKCYSSCSADGAHEVCRLLLILCLTGPNSFVDAVTTAASTTTSTTTSTAAPTTNLTANSTTPQSVNLTADTATVVITDPAAEAEAAPTVPTTKDTTVPPKADKTDWFKTLLYPALVLVACAVLFLIYRKRHQILACIQDDPESSRSHEDVKGRYRKLPTFEKTVPSLQEIDKAKSYVY